MGASSKKRKAYAGAVSQLIGAINQIKPIQEIKRVDSKLNRQFEEELGSSASGRLNYLSRKADSVARKINKDDDYKAKAGRFNDRYSILKEQMADRDVTRYALRDSPYVEQPNKPTGTNIDHITAGNIIPENRPKFENVIASNEEAMKLAQQRADEYNNNQDNFKPYAVNKLNSWGTIESTQMVTNPKATADKFLQGVTYASGKDSWESKFNVLNEGYEDMARLSDSVKNSAGNQNIGLYSSLADKLKTQYKRDAGNVTNTAKPTGLLASELAGNPLAGEVIT